MSRFLVIFAFTVGCSHDTDRANPVDPQLTPAVTVSAHLDSSGAAQLSWTAYQGEQPFARYLVLRNVARSTQVDTLAMISDAGLVEFRDTALTPDTAYEYRIGAQNAEGYVSTSASQRIEGFSVSAVQLKAPVADPTTGAVALTWSRFTDPGFAGYRVVRRQVGTDAEIILAQIITETDTAFVDTSARHQVDYLYRVDVEAAGQTVSGAALEGRVDLPSVSIESVDMQSITASSKVSWTLYAGPRFARYEVYRLAEGQLDSLVAVVDNAERAEAADFGLHGNTEYEYRVTVVTTAEERVSGHAVAGKFHQLIDSWPLTANPSLRHTQLTVDPEGAILATVSGSDGFSDLLSRFVLTESGLRMQRDGEGRALERVDLARFGFPNTARSRLSLNGELDLVLLGNRADEQGVTAPDRVVIVEADSEGLRRQRKSLFVDRLARVPTIAGPVTARLAVLGEWTLVDNLTVTADGEQKAAERSMPSLSWIYANRPVADFFHLRTKLVPVGGREELWVAFADTADSGARFEADVMRVPDDTEQDGHASIAIETSTGSVKLTLSFATDELILERFESGSGDPAESFSEPFLWASNIDYRLGLSIEDGGVEVWIDDPVLWLIEKEYTSIWAHLVATDDHVIAVVDEQPYRLEAEQGLTPLASLDSAPSDVHVWPASRGSWVGMVMPELNQVYQGISLDGDWPRRLSPWLSADRTIGGSGPGQFLYPTALAAGPDGRVYLIDAGNARIQVFDEDGGYITQWGSLGSGEGQFDFGHGETLSHGGLDFAGSIAVDPDGFIYVADVGNRRILRFAP